MLQKISSFFFWWFSHKHFQFFMRCFVFTFFLYMVRRFWFWFERLTDWWFHYTEVIRASRQVNPLPTMSYWMVPIFWFFVFSVLILYLFGRKQHYLIIIIFLISAYVQFVDQASAFTLNKYYTLFFLLACFAVPYVEYEKDDTWVDNTWQKMIPVRLVRIMQMTLLIQYFTAGSCKLLRGDRLIKQDILWSQIQWLYCTDIAARMLRNFSLEHWSWMENAWLYFELLFPFFILLSFWRKLRFLKCFILMVWIWFHVMIALTMKDLIDFSQQLIVMYILLLTTTEFEFLRSVVYRFFQKAKKHIKSTYIN